MKSATVYSIAFTLALCSTIVAQQRQPPVGFFNSFPAVVAGMDDEMPRTSPSLITCIAGGFSTVRQEGAYDFSVLDRQIQYAARHQLPLSIISEINPFFAPPWLVQQAQAAGELVCNGSGSEGIIPSITSPRLRVAQEQLVEQVARHLQQHEDGHVVQYIHPGAEWWFPYAQRYGKGDVERFRQWLETRYETIDRLNQTWESAYASFAQVQPPQLDLIGSLTGTQLLRPVALDNGFQDCSWSTPQATDPEATTDRDGIVEVEPGRTYTLSVWVKGESVTGRGPYLELAWVGQQGGPPLGIESSSDPMTNEQWQQLSVTAVAPPEAKRAWPLLKFAGTGTAVFDEVLLREGDSPSNLVPNGDFESGTEAPEQWSFQNWTGGQNVESEFRKQGGRDNSRGVSIRIQALDPATRGYANDHAATYDWTMYWYETAARYINEMAALVKRQDPSRKTVSYLTFSFAFPAEWDYTQQYAIAPDEVARQGRDIDILGMQLCSADGDPYRATASLDVVRKYRKPTWVVDLVDFTSGIHIGLPTMRKVTQAVIAHGAQGIVYCGWHLTVVQDYSYWPAFSPEGLQKMLTGAQQGIRHTQGLSVDAEAALIHTMMPLCPADMPAGKNDFRSFMGWYKVLQAMQTTVDVVTLRELEIDSATLAGYRYVVVPDCEFLPQEALLALNRYAARGGRIITMERFARFDEYGRALPPDLRGSCERLEIADYGRDYSGVMKRDRHAGNTPPLFLWRADTPATETALADATSCVRGVLGKHAIVPRVELARADQHLQCVLWRGENRRLVYLVNMNDDVAKANELIVRSPLAGAVTVLPDLRPTACESSFDKGILRVQLPEFHDCCLVEIDSSEVE